ncbi:hypothetical protein TNCV_2983211 [Trichonephila clavipes]|nr:hypothetical protein TNCV_2983211 [Trichonephila clavipes]
MANNTGDFRQTVSGDKGEQSNPAEAVDQYVLGFELLLGSSVDGGRSTGGEKFHLKLALIRKYGGALKIKSQAQFLRGCEKKKRRNGMTRKSVEIKEGSLGYPGFVKPMFTKDSKPLGK